MKRTTLYNLIVIIAALICSAFVINLIGTRFQNRALGRAITAELKKYKISDKELVGKKKITFIEKRYWIPRTFPIDEFSKHLKKALEKEGFSISISSTSTTEQDIKGKKELREEATYWISRFPTNVPIFRLTLIRKVPYPKAKVPIAPAKAKVAIVLDDWGYNIRNLSDVLQIDEPLNLAILPNLRYSTTIAKKAKENNFEVILHMSMEPKSKIRLELNTIYTTMKEDEIKAHLAKALKSVPYANGVSNHEGSKATEDERTMRIVFGELKKQGLYFLDSLVTNDSVCEPLSRETGIKFAQRSIFLDNEDDPAYIKKQFEQLMDVAIKTGDAVGIGHDKANTVKVLREMLPEFKAKGIQLTYVSGLAR